MNGDGKIKLTLSSHEELAVSPSSELGMSAAVAGSRMRMRRRRFRGWEARSGELHNGEWVCVSARVVPRAISYVACVSAPPREALRVGAGVGLPATISDFISRRVRIRGAGGWRFWALAPIKLLGALLEAPVEML